MSTDAARWMSPYAAISLPEEKLRLPVTEKRAEETEEAAGKPAASFYVDVYLLTQNYSAEIAPTGQASAHVPQSTQASASIT